MTPKDVKALAPITVTSYQCPVCKKLHLAVDKAAQCTKKCGADAYRKDLARRHEERRQESMDWVRLNATSPRHAIRLIEEQAKTFGLIVHISQYPNELGNVFNSHGAPNDFPRVWSSYENKKNLPTTYPGFRGRWEGTVRGKCPNKACWNRNKPDLGCLFECLLHGFFSGTGCPAEDFSIGGYFFLYDFPKMIEPAGLSKTLREVYPRLNGLNLVEVVAHLSPKLIEASKQFKKPLFIDIRSDTYILREHSNV
jgi:hypothetical protein